MGKKKTEGANHMFTDLNIEQTSLFAMSITFTNRTPSPFSNCKGTVRRNSNVLSECMPAEKDFHVIYLVIYSMHI